MELESQYGEKGLSVIGVTGEPAGLTEKWVAQHKATYAYAYDRGNKLHSAVGAGGWPHAVLIDGSGVVVWEGHPGGLNDSEIEKHLATAFPKPLWEWPSSADKVKKAYLAGTLGKALKEARDLEEGDFRTSTVGALETMIRSRVEQFAAKFERGDLMGMQETQEVLVAAVEGLPDAERVSELVKKAEEHPDRKRILAGQKAVRDIKGGKLRSKNDLRKAIEKAEDIEKDYAGTYAATEAGDLRRSLVARLNGRD